MLLWLINERKETYASKWETIFNMMTKSKQESINL